MTRTLRCLVVLLFCGTLVSAQEPPKPTAAQLVEELADPSFAKREKATQALWEMGEDARLALEAALQHPKVEVVRRAKQILNKFDAGILPNITPELRDLIEKFRNPPANRAEKARMQAVRELCHISEAGPATLRRLILKEITDPDARRRFYYALTDLLREEVPLLILQGQSARAEALLEITTTDTTSVQGQQEYLIPGISRGQMDYAILCAQRGTAKEAIARLEARLKVGRPDSPAIRRALVFLNRATGQMQAAKLHAAELEKRDGNFRNIHNSLLEDLGEWATLAERSEATDVNSRDGLKIFHLRKSGRLEDAKKLADDQKDQELGLYRTSSGLMDPATLALMLNDRPLDGIERLKMQGNAPHILADVLASRLQFREALDLVTNNKGDEASALDRGFLRQLHGTRKGRLLWQLGQRDAAAQIFNKLAQEITGGPENRDGRPYGEFAIAQLVRTEVRAGRYDLACEHLATALAVAGHDGIRPANNGQDPFELIFDQEADVAAFWWRVLRAGKPDNETAAETMLKVRRLLTGQATKAEREKAIKLGQADTGPQRRRPDRDGRRDEPIESASEEYWLKPLAISAIHRAVGELADAVKVLEAEADVRRQDDPEIPSDYDEYRPSRGGRRWIFGVDEDFRFWVELGDLLMEQGKPQEAARRYYQGWLAHRNYGLLLNLSGRALLKVGQEVEGKKRIEASHWVGLGNPRIRGRFLEDLVTRGMAVDVRREIDRIRQCGWISELYIGNVWNQVARGSILLKDFETAGLAHTRAIYYLLRTPGVSYVEGYAYLTVPQAVRVAEARRLIGLGQTAAGVEITKECLTIMPGNNDLTLGVVPVLDKQGHKAEAEAIFRQVWSAYNKIIEQHPTSAWARGQAAWLAAGCRRELPKALELAKKAVELEPNMKSFQETLAEVQFRNGNREEAVALMKKLITQDRRSFHYKRQLERYQTAAFDSPLPDTDDD